MIKYWARVVAELVEYWPNIYEILGLISSTTQMTHDGTCL